MSIEQLPLFPGNEPQTVTQRSDLSADSPLSTAMERFRDHMVQQDYAENTIKSFLGDLRILGRYLKQDPPVGQISTKNLQDYLHWLQHERGKPCSPKSYARRLTTLKVFFAWLARPGGHTGRSCRCPWFTNRSRPRCPASSTTSRWRRCWPSPSSMRAGDTTAEKPDPRPHLLVTLLLHTGIKKQECMGIKLIHIDTSNVAGPAVHIRYDKPRMQYKERRLRLPSGWAQYAGRIPQGLRAPGVPFSLHSPQPGICADRRRPSRPAWPAACPSRCCAGPAPSATTRRAWTPIACGASWGCRR